MISGISNVIGGIYKRFRDCTSSRRAFSRALHFRNVQEARRLLKSGAIHSATHSDFMQAACLGDLEIINALLDFPEIQAGVAAKDNMALKVAALSGHLAVVNRLLEFPVVVAAIAADYNATLRGAAGYGHLAVMNRLLEFPVVVAAIVVGDNAALRWAADSGHLAVVNRLLEFPAVMAAVTADNNGALRRALHNERHEIVARLRQIPAVVAYEAAHAENGLTAIAQDNESAIRDLSSAEIEELSALKKRYAALFQEQGLEGILSGLRKHLIAKYHENPAQYQGQALPLEYDGKLDKEARKEYYKNPYHTAYRYLFCQPNPWMAPDAHWVNRDAQGRASANISDGTKANIAYLWLAASDNEAPLPKGYTRDDIQNRFIDLLVDAGRGHNWDKKRTKTILKNKEQVEVQEAFDDGEGDKPSCSLGVTRRTAAQFFLLLQPAVKPLNIDAIYLQFKESLVTHNSQKNGLFDKMIALDASKLKDLKLALENLAYAMMKKEALSKAEQDLLQEISIDASALKSFVAGCHQDFGGRFTAKTNLKWQGENFDSYEKLVQHFTQNALAAFYNELTKKSKDLTPEKPATPEAPASIILPMPAAPLLFSDAKKSRKQRRRSEGQLLESSFSTNSLSPCAAFGLRRSARLASKKAPLHDDGFAPKRRCRRGLYSSPGK